MSQPLASVWPAVVTPVRADGSACLETVEKLVELFVSQKLGGLYLTGSTGQWPLFSASERMAVVERAVKTAAGRIPIMVHVGAATTADAVLLARHAESVGADAISAVGPIYYGYTVDTLFAHYTAIGQACKLPFYVYHLSTVSKASVGAREYVERLLQIPTVAGMKITDHDLYPFGLIRAYAGDKLTLFSGADEVLCHGILSGADGAIGTFYNVWGAECKAGWDATKNGDIAAGIAFTRRFQPALDAVLTSGGIWSFIRAAMRIRFGLEIGMPRPPMAATDKPWTDADVERVLDMMK